jgi:hypothetical protein
MFDLRDLSNSAIVLLFIMLFASVVTVQAIMPSLAGSTAETAPNPRVNNELAVDPDMAFHLIPQDIVVHSGDTFVVAVAVENAKDMFGWQTYLCFDPGMLEAVGVSLPPNHVFSSSVTVSGALFAYDAADFPLRPLQGIDNHEGRLLAGDCLLGADQPTYYGSGFLCLVEFKAVSPGSTTIALLRDSANDFQTFNLNFDIEAITAPLPAYANIYIAPS